MGASPLKRAFANVAAGTTDANLVGAVPGHKIRVVWLVVIAGATATVLTFNSKPAGAGNPISPDFPNASNGGFALPPNQEGWLETNSGEGLTCTSGAGSSTAILIGYVEVSP